MDDGSFITSMDYINTANDKAIAAYTINTEEGSYLVSNMFRMVGYSGRDGHSVRLYNGDDVKDLFGAELTDTDVDKALKSFYGLDFDVEQYNSLDYVESIATAHGRRQHIGLSSSGRPY